MAYSTSISAAWEVVEKIELFKTHSMGYRKDLHVYWIDHEEIGTVAFEKTIPHTICLAALKAVGE